jgi:hypothetical protein
MEQPILLRPSERIDMISQGIEPPGVMDLRQPITETMKRLVTEAFSAVPEGKRGALIVLADESGARVHVAAKIGDHWKVAASAGVKFEGEARFGAGVIGAW